MLKILKRVGLLMPLALLLTLTSVQARAQVAVDSMGGDVIHAGEFVVPINKSQVLKVDQPFTELLIGNSDIADVVALTNQSVYVLGKQLGTTNLTIYGPQRQLLAVLDLVVSYDVESLKAKLSDVMPGEAIEVRAVSGGVPAQRQHQQRILAERRFGHRRAIRAEIRHQRDERAGQPAGDAAGQVRRSLPQRGARTRHRSGSGRRRGPWRSISSPPPACRSRRFRSASAPSIPAAIRT